MDKLPSLASHQKRIHEMKNMPGIPHPDHDDFVVFLWAGRRPPFDDLVEAGYAQYSSSTTIFLCGPVLNNDESFYGGVGA